MNTSSSARWPDPQPAFALLAAGSGQRFGGRKLTADLGGKPLWRWAADSAVSAGLRELHIVTNDMQIAHQAGAIGWSVHSNDAVDEGVASSIRIAVRAAASASSLVVALADMPFIEPAHFLRLASTTGVAFTAQPDGRAGVPAAFSSINYAKLAALTGNRGAAGLSWPGSTILPAASPDSVFDVDTAADLEQARAIALRLQREASR